MSKFSGKCDLFDHIMMGKLYKSPDNLNIYLSDEMECFELFKEATGGIIYKHTKIEVNEYNQKLVSELCKYFTFDKLPKLSPRCKQKYKYKYFDKEYTLDQLNKKGVYIDIPIYFKTILDIIPYYPYICLFIAQVDGKQHVIISSKSYVDEQLENHLTYGYMPCIDYKSILQTHYIDIVNRYFNIEGRRITKTFKIESNTDLRKFNVGEAIDYNWGIEVARDKHLLIYSVPKIVDADKGIIDISQVWPDDVLETITLTYVKKQEHKLYLE